MRRNQVLKSMTALAVLVVLITIIVVITAFRGIPTITQLQNTIQAAARIQKPVVPAQTESPALDVTQNQGGQNQTTDAPQEPPSTPAPIYKPTLSEEDQITRYIISRFIDRGRADIRVCENLQGIQGRGPQNRAQFYAALLTQAQQRVNENPFVEAALAPIGRMLQRRSVVSVITQIVDASSVGDENLIQTPAFNSSLSAAAADLISNRIELERGAQTSYHLFVLANAVARNPGLAMDARTMTLCERLQRQLEAPPSSTPVAPDVVQTEIDQDKAALLRFLAESGLAPSQVRFEPSMNVSADFQMSYESIGPQVSWMRKYLGTSVTLINPFSEIASMSGTTNSAGDD